ncbi:LysR family transcriptional regulator [Bordetella holmesii]|uniref:LysR substrate-binding domain protein n=2 Tax=Bordetella holmesii TaxID=35814 RepID=A0A158M0S8_9BORD|nr:LysR family transcriptional regulator [Bordetella holmesii]AHV91543.1 bacterial regulatory helix-turn-helix, lysR family protein [Bordetella holmesii ATCC 51541]AIT25267.1 bacterial regulatory helix-turn-helix, lysR family protein [Bordetella holmesii 44057]EWM45830.1 bacterial regulatory helix-turn-helix, lysR family protein [Bordetella holmesii 70147]EWM48672.1 bacterial regulatory helix-turn-helix, lysR family protein [Bordetella holmesii 41130]EWM49960.1 bacterial regulatory helix-turn-
MRIEDAEVFLKLAEHQNVRRTAERVGLTQSAVTKVLQRLEAEFGLPLMERRASGVVPTRAGQLLQEKALALIGSYDSLRHEMAAAQSAQQSVVRVGIIPALLDAKLLPVLAIWRKQHPGQFLQISVKVSDELTEMVCQGDLDLAIGFAPTPRSDLQTLALGPQRYHVVVRAGHPLSLPGRSTMQALAQAEWLLPAPSVGMRLWVERAFIDLGLPIPVTAVQTDTSTAQFAGLIRASNLVTALMTPMFMSPAGKGLVELPFDAESSMQPLVLLTRRAAYLSPTTRALRDALHRAFIAST